MDTEVLDTHAYHDNTTNNSRLTVPTGLGGEYLVVGAAWWDLSSAVGSRYTRIYKNNSAELALQANPANTVALRQQVVWYGTLAPGDYVELGTFQDSGGTRPVGDATNDAALFFQMFRIGGAPTPGVGQTDGWTLDDAATWTYVSATTFTVPGDYTTKFSKGTRIKLTQTTVKYFVVTASSFGSGVTTVTITGGTDYTLANAAISANYYSYAANPQGYPDWFNYTPTYVGFSADPPSSSARFSVVGRACSLILVTGAGTSNNTNFEVTLPVASVTAFQVPARITDNSANQTTMGKFNLNAATVNSSLNKDMNNAAFTASGTKSCTVAVTYDI
jgi:hypothetical protein